MLSLPDLFPSVTDFLLCALVIVGGQLIYAAAGFGAGMFAITLMALILPDLPGAVATLFVLTLVTEIYVLSRVWRQGSLRLLLGLLPTTAFGTWAGSHLLVHADVTFLKRSLGGLIALAGLWFLREEAVGSRASAPAGTPDGPAATARRRMALWISAPAGFAAGLLTGLFGIGGPPVVVLLKGYRLEKAAFRATLLWYFLTMSVIRGAFYTGLGALTVRELEAAAWLLPASVLGMLLGMGAHRSLSELGFRRAVSVLLLIAGTLLLIAGGR